MSLSRNLVAGIGVSAWSALISIFVVPFYLRYLGVESYGLIGFFGALQALFSMLDFGMTPTINREVARGSAVGDFTESRILLRSVGCVYWLVAAAIAAMSLVGGPLVADHWLQANRLPPEAVRRAVVLMGLIVACRWPGGVYGSALVGAQRLVLLSAIGAVMITLSALGSVFVLAFVSPTLDAYFAWQAALGIAQVVLMRLLAWRALGGHWRTRFEMNALKRVWRFSAGLGIAGILGLILVQSDKIVLSRMVTLEELGRYTLAGLTSRMLYMLLTPVFTAIYPRMSALVMAKDETGLIELYRNGTRLLMAVICPAAIYISLFSAELFQLWTGNHQLAGAIPLTMTLLTVGTALNGAMHFPYALQLAYGGARLPLIITASLVVLFIPMLVALTQRFGIAGAAGAWLVLNLLYLFFGTWLTHRTLLKAIGMPWLVEDVVMPAAVSFAIVGGGRLLIDLMPLSTLERLLFGGVMPILALATIGVVSPSLCELFRAKLSGWRHAKRSGLWTSLGVESE